MAAFLCCLRPALPAPADLVLPGQPVAARNADGQLAIFEVDAAGQLRQRWQNKSNGDWSPWRTLGGTFLPGMAVASGADGRIRVFGVDRDTHALRCRYQRTTNSMEWEDWKSLGGNIEPPITAVLDAGGRLEVFAVAANGGAAEHIREADTGWSGWASLGGSLEPGLAAATNADGTLEVFGIESGTAALTHCWQQRTNSDADWSPWTSLAGTIQPGFDVGRNAVGRLEVFALNATNSKVVRLCQAKPGDHQQWTPWEDFSSPPLIVRTNTSRDLDQAWPRPNGPMKPHLVAARSGDNRLDIFAVDAESGTLLHRWETMVNGADRWSTWASLGIVARPWPAIASNEDGDLEVFVVDPANPDLIHHRRQISSASDWLDWSTLDHRTFPYASRTWQLDEGLPDNLVQAITQTADGFLWIGTRDGLARFDGDHFFCYDPRNTPALKNPSITALCADRDGALWIGTDGGGLIRLKNGIFTIFSQADGVAGNAVRVIFQSRDGTVWIGTTTGMSRWHNERLDTYKEQNGLLSEVVRSIYEDQEGDLWIATGKGLNRLRKNGTMDAFAMPDGLPDDSVRAICQDRGGRIWIGSNNGLLWYNWFWGNNFYAYNTKYGLSDTFVSAICEDNGGNVWVGTYSGLNRFREGRFYNQPDGDGQAFDKVNALFIDREGDLWVGSKEGLSRMREQKFFTYTKQQGLTHNNIMSVLQDRAGHIWAGTWGGGLSEMQNESVTPYASTNALSQDLILSLCVAHDGSLWAGADFDGGLMHLKNGAVTRYTWQDGLYNAGVRVLHEDTQGRLWIGSDRGMNCLVQGRLVTNAVTERLAGTSVRDICEAPASGLWIATDNGLDCWHGKQLTHFSKADGLADNVINALFMDADETLWIGGSTGGLTRFRKGTFSVYAEPQGLYSNEILGLIGDDQGWLWMTCSTGVFRVRKSDFDDLDHGRIDGLASVAYGKNDGLKSVQCNGNGKPSVWKSSDGRLWFPTTKGLVAVDPKTVGTDGKPPAVYIETITADGKIIETGRTNLAGPTFVLGTRSRTERIPPGNGQLVFQYSALGYSAPEKERFKYRLNGVDSDWIAAGSRRVAFYNSLAPGRYRFDVRACNRDGVWNNVGASQALELLPHYWQTLWFRGTLAGAVLVLVGGLVFYVGRRRIQRRLTILERQQAIEKERGRIAKDFHDQIGAGLTQIALLGEFARRDANKTAESKAHAEKIAGLARELAQSLDEIVWTVNPRNDTLNKLAAYLAAYAEEYFQGTPIRCRLDIPPGLPSHPLSAELRHNLFLTVKEALNNVAKHSRAKEVHLRLALVTSGVELTIQDSGVGFEQTRGSRGGNGLLNMRARMEEIGGRLEIQSDRAGTRIWLWVPLVAAPAK